MLQEPGVVIQGTGRFLPEHVVDNKAIEKIINTSDEFIVKRTGVLGVGTPMRTRA